MSDPKADLHRYLDVGREAMVWKLEGLSEYDIRRPLTPTGTNLLGLIKHLASVELGYFGDCFERPHGEAMPWFEDGAEPNDDMWATETESREDILGLYERARRHADATIEALTLEDTAHVPWWPDDRNRPTLHRLLIHMATETHRHAGHADIVRELIDAQAGLREGVSNLPEVDDRWWDAYRARLEETARRHL